MKTISEPFYQLEIKTANCYIEVLVNNLPIFCNYENGGMTVDYPINDAIFKSGKQALEVRIIAPKRETSISKYARYEIKVFVKEANMEASGRELVYTLPMREDFRKKPLPIIIHKNYFEAEVPYRNIGWSNSVNLKELDENQLLQEIKNYLTKITSIYNSRNELEYEKLYNARMEEHSKSFYLTREEMSDYKDSKFLGLPEKLESIVWDLYHMVFYGDNRLVSLQTKHQPPGFVFESVNKDEYGFTEMLSFHKKDKNAALEIIR